MRWSILPNGDLEIRINEEEQARLREDRANAAEPGSLFDFESEQAMRAVLEPLITDDEYEWVEPAWIGALTDAPILGIFGEDRPVPDGADMAFLRCVGRWQDEDEVGYWVTYYTPVQKAWYFEPYAVRSPQEDLAESGRCVFKKAPMEGQHGSID